MTYCFHRYMKAFFNPQKLFFPFVSLFSFFLLFFFFCSKCYFVETHKAQVVKVSKHRKCEILSLKDVLKKTSVSENIVEEGLGRLQEPVEVDDYNKLMFYVHNKV